TWPYRALRWGALTALVRLCCRGRRQRHARTHARTVRCWVRAGDVRGSSPVAKVGSIHEGATRGYRRVPGQDALLLLRPRPPARRSPRAPQPDAREKSRANPVAPHRFVCFGPFSAAISAFVVDALRSITSHLSCALPIYDSASRLTSRTALVARREI